MDRNGQADDFLPPEKAFAFSAKVVDDSTVRLHWDIAPGYHLYRERISVQADVRVHCGPAELAQRQRQVRHQLQQNHGDLRTGPGRGYQVTGQRSYARDRGLAGLC